MTDFERAAAYEAAITVQTFARLIALDLASGRAPNHLEMDCVTEWAIAAEAFLKHSYSDRYDRVRAETRREIALYTPKVPA